MADNKNAVNSNFKEAVCIDAGRVYDSCCDRDCLEDLRCYFSAESQNYINNAISVKLKSAEVASTYIEVEPVNLNHGFYSCDLTFFFVVTLDVYSVPRTAPNTVKGIAVFNKKVILFGSEGGVKVFTSTSFDGSSLNNNLPKCVVQCVEPVCLNATLGMPTPVYDNLSNIPTATSENIGGQIITDTTLINQTVYVTLGLFSIVQLVRDVQMLVPVFDYAIPEKQCTDNADSPCDLFNKIKFPTDDFFPPKSCSTDSTCGCGCNG